MSSLPGSSPFPNRSTTNRLSPRPMDSAKWYPVRLSGARLPPSPPTCLPSRPSPRPPRSWTRSCPGPHLTSRLPMIHPPNLKRRLRCLPPPRMTPLSPLLGPDAPALTVRVPPLGTDYLTSTVVMPAVEAHHASATSIPGLVLPSLAHRLWRCVPLPRRSRHCPLPPFPLLRRSRHRLLPLFYPLFPFLLSQRRYLLLSNALAVFCSSLPVFTEVTVGRYATRASRMPRRTSPTVPD